MLRLFLVCLLLVSCASRPPEFRKFASGDELAKYIGFTKKIIKGKDFWVTTYGKVTDKSKPYVFYIEGDGDIRGDEPTPKGLMLLNLAALDKRPNVYYISRLCQYTPMHLNPKCHRELWDELRYSKTAVNELNVVINQLNDSNKFDLVGFSGGATIAILIAAQNNQVNSILTIAGNLSVKEFIKYHHISSDKLKNYLDPVLYLEAVKHIPQLHIAGGRDKIVPSNIINNFVNKANSKCVHREIIPEAEHNYYWLKYWDYIMSLKISC